MNEDPGLCAKGRACEVQFDYFREDLTELKERVRRLEAAIEHGVMLLVANLIGVVITLAEQLIG